jgi:hypothetical protein
MRGARRFRNGSFATGTSARIEAALDQGHVAIDVGVLMLAGDEIRSHDADVVEVARPNAGGE